MVEFDWARFHALENQWLMPPEPLKKEGAKMVDYMLIDSWYRLAALQHRLPGQAEKLEQVKAAIADLFLEESGLSAAEARDKWDRYAGDEADDYGFPWAG